MTAPRTRITNAGRLAVALGGLLRLLVLGIIGVSHGVPSHAEVVPATAIPETIERRAVVTVALPTPHSLATLPTITPRREGARSTAPPPPADYASPSRPVLDAQRRISSLPRITSQGAGASSRTGCDPAYPEERTCIPPGPPLDVPCASTEEREFTVLPPNPRRLDADGDGIGCEPITP